MLIVNRNKNAFKNLDAELVAVLFNADVDADGAVEKSAHDKLTEAVNEAITSARDLAASVKPTRVVGQGASTGTKSGGEGGEEPSTSVGPLTEALLQEAGFSDPDKVYAPVGG